MKAGGTYPDIVQGVSEKQPHRRRAGQMTEQVNILPDSVHGLARRRGTRKAAHQLVTLSDAVRQEMATMDVFDFTLEGVEYALVYRRYPSANSDDTFAFLFNKVTEEFVPIVYENSEWIEDLVAGGVSAVTSAGRYVYIAGNTTLPFAVQEDVWDVEGNLKMLAAWVRAGRYSSTYTITLTTATGTTVTASHTTPPATYPGTLDTSGIDFFEMDGITPRPDYQKDINDAVNAYNSAVNEWITTAAQAITPEAIALELQDALLSVGVTSVVLKGGIGIDDADYVDISIEDGGDNTTAYAAGREIVDATRVTKYHYHGKIVRVRPSGGGDDQAYYLQARLDSGATSGFGAVSWFEAPGVTAEIDNIFAQMIVHDGTAYIAQDGAGLLGLAPTSGPHVAYQNRKVGDGVTSPLPYFIGRRITLLTMFQDRLIVGCDNIINASKTGDYLDFFRNSVLNIADNDPVEVFAHGSEGDTLRGAVLYNGDLILFGDQQQYGSPGQQMLTPKAPIIKPISANRDSTDAAPKTSGNFIFYAQYGDSTPSLHQMRVGALTAQSTITDSLSEDLDKWLFGQPLQITTFTKPNYVLLRTTGYAHGVYFFKYEDSLSGERTQAAWGKVLYNEALGTIIGISGYKKSGIIFTAREDRVVADVLSFNAELDDHGYMDSRVPVTDVASLGLDGTDEVVAVVDSTSDYFLMGTTYERLDELTDLVGSTDGIYAGVVSPGIVTPTNPFVRDRNGQAVLDGRLTLSRLTVDVKDTSGMQSRVRTRNGVVGGQDFEGRILGTADTVPDRQPVYTGQLPASVGYEVREVSVDLLTKDWLPLNITGIQWTGQSFNNVRRVS